MGRLLVAFPYDRAVTVPMASLTVVLIVLIIAFWRDFGHMRLRESNPPR